MNSDFIHYNRDENSFTARFFERLILRFENDNKNFINFLITIQKAAEKNKSQLANSTLQTPNFDFLVYQDSMPFMENIDLYSSQSKAYGNNLKQVDNSPLRYAIFSGDVNQDGSVNLADVLNINNDANTFVSVYVVTDLTGIELVDINDVLR